MFLFSLFRRLVLAALVLQLRCEATFRLYSGRDIDEFAKEVGVNRACMAALNNTLNCADTFLEYALDQEAYLWKPENLTAGCTTECKSDMEKWIKRVTAACRNAKMAFAGMYINPVVLPLMYRYNFDLACLKDENSNWCRVESQGWKGSDIKRYPSDLCSTGHKDWDADICFEEGFDQDTIEPDDVRLASLYEKSMICSQCFLKVFHHRLTSPLLRPSEYTDYLIEQHKDLESVCATKMPLTTATETYFLGVVPLPTATPSGVVSVAVNPPTLKTCLGTLIQPPTRLMNCHKLSIEFNVTTGDLMVLTGDFSCFVTKPICAPPPCELIRIGWGETCESLRKKISTSKQNVTDVQFSDWNPRIIGSCDKLRTDQYICKSPPGGTYKAPPAVFALAVESSFFTTAIPPKPTSTGTTKVCGKYYDVTSGDTCQGIAMQNGITLDTFQDLNTQVYRNCTNLWLNYSYCVAPVTKPPISKDGKCGPAHAHAYCENSGFGDCCSLNGACGSGDQFCGAGNCHSGKCDSPLNGLSQDGSCGPDHNNWLCGGKWGKCCSVYGHCGDTSEHCGSGICYSGKCNTEEGGKSLDGSCGPQFAGNKTCTGTQFGACCNKDGYCGDGSKFCSKETCSSGACSS